jgi:CBS domain-containing protein
MTIRAILDGRDGGIWSAARDERVADVVARLTEKRIGAVPVLDGDAVVGIFSERDVMHCLTAHGAGALDMLVGDVMTSPVVSIESDSAVLTALSLMSRRRFRHLPVIDGNTLVGFVSIGDLVKYRIERIEAEAAAMRDYIAGA